MTVGGFIPPKRIERRASELLQRYVARSGRVLRPPISAELVLDTALGDELRSPLWEPLVEPPGRRVLAALTPAERQIRLNEARRGEIEACAGWENTLVAHEIGHWVLHVDRAQIGQPRLPWDGTDTAFACDDGADDAMQERAAGRFAANLLLPRDLLAPMVHDRRLDGWRALYELREQLGVTISMLRVRLEELCGVHVDGDGRFHRSRGEALGQIRLLG